MLSSYLNQTAEYRKRTGENNRGEPVFSKAATIPCRCVKKVKEIITPDKRVVKAEYSYTLSQSVSEGDSLDGRSVQLVHDAVMLGGTVLGCKAVT